MEPESKSALLFRRHTSLICLICRTSVYRVLQLIPPDLDVGEGLVLPTEEWVEQEILRSGSGWIELAKQCLVSPLTLWLHLTHFVSIQRWMNQWLSYEPRMHIHPCSA